MGANDLNENARLDSGDVTRVLKTAVRLVVKNAPTGQSPRIMVHPKSRVMRNGQTYVFRVQATGTQPLSYQWYQNGKLKLIGEDIDFVMAIETGGMFTSNFRVSRRPFGAICWGNLTPYSVVILSQQLRFMA